MSKGSRGVALGDVQSDEIVKFILDFRAGGGGETHAAEEFGEFVDHFAEDVAISDAKGRAGLGHVEPILG